MGCMIASPAMATKICRSEERLVTEGLGIKTSAVSLWYQYGRDARLAWGEQYPALNGRIIRWLPAGQNCGSESALAPYHLQRRSGRTLNGTAAIIIDPFIAGARLSNLKLMTSNGSASARAWRR